MNCYIEIFKNINEHLEKFLFVVIIKYEHKNEHDKKMVVLNLLEKISISRYKIRMKIINKYLLYLKLISYLHNKNKYKSYKYDII